MRHPRQVETACKNKMGGDFCGFVEQVQLPTYIDNVREKLAENIHELWAMGKIEQGWMYGEVRVSTCSRCAVPVSHASFPVTTLSIPEARRPSEETSMPHQL